MKKFKLDLSEWKITVMVAGENHTMKEETVVYPFRQNLSVWLRSAGVFKTGEDIVEAVTLGKRLLNLDEDSAVLDSREADILKKCVNKHLEASASGKIAQPIGGPAHEEAILRVFGMVEMD